MSLTCHSQKPATNSRVSAKGPSMTVRLGPSKATRLPWDEGFRPSPASMMPALTSSSLNLPMAARSSVEGMTPASDSFVAFQTAQVPEPLGLLSHPGHEAGKVLSPLDASLDVLEERRGRPPHDPKRLPHGAPGFEVSRIGADPRVHDGVIRRQAGTTLWFPLDRDGVDKKTLAGGAGGPGGPPPPLGGRGLAP